MPAILISVCRFVIFCTVALCISAVRRLNLTTTMKLLILVACLFGSLNAWLIITELWGITHIHQELLKGFAWFTSHIELYMGFTMVVCSSRLIDWF